MEDAHRLRCCSFRHSTTSQTIQRCSFTIIQTTSVSYRAYHRQQQQLVTSGSEMNGVQRQLVIILSLLMILLNVALVLLCLELSLISNVHVVVVLYLWTAHSKWVLVCFISFTLFILIATIQCFQNFFVYYQIHRQHIKVYRSPDNSQSIHRHSRFQSSGPQRGTFCFPELDTSWLSFSLRSSPLQKTTRVRSELESIFRS